MDMQEKRQLGGSGLEVSVHGFGGVPLGNLYQKCSNEDAQATLLAAYSAGIRFIDTAPFYGLGMSEHRIGHIMRPLPRDSWVLSTKIGRVLKAKDPAKGIDAGPFVDAHPMEYIFDYTYDGVMRSVEDSLQRLATHRIDVLLIHDVDVWTHGSEDARKARFKEVMDSGYKAMRELRDSGTVKAIGAGINEIPATLEFMRAGEFDCFLLAGRYTLLEQAALDDLLPECTRRNISLIIGGPYNSGILATGAVKGAKYNYADAPPDIMARVGRIEAVCNRHGIPLKAAALQFPLGHPKVATIIPGARSVTEIDQNVATFTTPIPDELWAELKHERLLREDAPTP